MLGTTKIVQQELAPYAIPADFCRIFHQDMNRLYLLSYLLTGDQALAEKCFVRGLEQSGKGNPVFREWARSWARRTIVQNAIQMLHPRPTNNSSPRFLHRSSGLGSPESAEIAAVIELPVFERFVFVMSVLEGYSHQECSLLLDCSRSQVQSACLRALQKIGEPALLAHRLVTAGSDEAAEREAPDSAVPIHGISHLAASA